MDNTENITVLSLCAGYGGLELGLSRALARTLRVVAVEIEAYALANLVSKTEESKLAIDALYPDLRTFPAERFSGCFDIVAAGYPCQPFSNAGKRKGTEDPWHLWPHIERIVQAVRPLWCFFENVPGHLSLGFPEVYKSLRLMGYKVEAGLFTACECVSTHTETITFDDGETFEIQRCDCPPHKRERLFILAHTTSVNDRGASRQIQSENEQQTQERQERRFAESGGSGELGNSGCRRCERPQGKVRSGRDAIISSGELAVADSQQGRSHAGGRECEAETRSGGEKLADTEDTEWRRVSEKHAGRRASEVGGSGRNKLADPTSIRPCGFSENATKNSTNAGRKKCRLYEFTGTSALSNHDTQPKWPARPGQEQYDWEEPRTVEPGMGRTVDGFASRVDELRLLGNGVVPEQAEKAFRELWRLFE